LNLTKSTGSLFSVTADSSISPRTIDLSTNDLAERLKQIELERDYLLKLQQQENKKSVQTSTTSIENVSQNFLISNCSDLFPNESSI
jgi:hypothetical protein